MTKKEIFEVLCNLISTYEEWVFPRIRRSKLNKKSLGKHYPYSKFNTLGMFLSIAPTYFRCFKKAFDSIDKCDVNILSVLGSPTRIRRYFLLLILGMFLDKQISQKSKVEFLGSFLSVYCYLVKESVRGVHTFDKNSLVGFEYEHENILHSYNCFDKLCIALREYCDLLWYGEHPIPFSISWPNRFGKYFVLTRRFRGIEPLASEIKMFECYPYEPLNISIDEFGGSLLQKPPRSERAAISIEINTRPLIKNKFVVQCENLLSQVVESNKRLLSAQETSQSVIIMEATKAYCHEIIEMYQIAGQTYSITQDLYKPLKKVSEITIQWTNGRVELLPMCYVDACMSACSYALALVKSFGEKRNCFMAKLCRKKPIQKIEKDIVSLSRICTFSPKEVGTKALNLGILYSYGYIVPQTIVLRQDFIASLVKSYVKNGAKSSVIEIQNRLCLDSRLSNAIIKALRVFRSGTGYKSTDALIIRSSASCEDTDYRSQAGMFQTFGPIQGYDKIIRAVAKCSTMIPQPKEKSPISVIIQPYELFIFGGVTMSVDPVGINRQYALSEVSTFGPTGVTSGIDIGLRAHVNRKTLTISWDSTTENIKFIKVAVNAILKTTLASIELEQIFGQPVDIEWGVKQNEIILYTQVRPLVTVSPKVSAISSKSVVRTENLVRGICASPGFIKGVVVCNKDSFLNKRFNSRILVTRLVEPCDFPVLFNVAGVICEEGGINSHVSINCRELGIPCLVGVSNACRKFPQGKKIILHATEGVAYLLD